MKTILNAMVLSICTGLLFILDVSVSPEFPLQVELTLVPEAQAILGVRRRAVRRGVVIGSSAAATTSAAAASQPVAAPAPAPAPASAPAPAPAAAPAGSPPLGSIASTLPAGCAATPINGVQYYKCGSGVYYRTAFQGNNLVYVVSQP